MHRYSWHIVASGLLLLVVANIFSQAGPPLPGEFHHGSGGFSVQADKASAQSGQVADTLGIHRFFGELTVWNAPEERFSVTILTVVDRNGSFDLNDRAVIVDRWKSLLADRASKEGKKVETRLYEFNGFKGAELTISGTDHSITRLFFVERRLYILSLTSETPLPKTHLPFLDSFRSLTKEERARAMIEEFAPPALLQEGGRGSGVSDAIELGLKGNVSRVRERFTNGPKSEELKVQEIHFNDAGFKTREIGFNEGFPDVITSWGWIDGKRVNLQSAVNYPDQGPKTSRRTVVSGYRSFPLGYDIAAFSRQYGNRIETDWDQSNRPFVRRRYSSNGSLVYVERFLYKEGSREVTTTDASGGFMGRTRELLDSRSNIIELQTLAENGQLFNITQFEYEFDEFQNWIIRKAFSKVGTRKGSPKKPAGTSTREISYHSFA